MSNIKRIFIVGHSGAGKGIIAQEVAKQLGWKFINADILGCAVQIGRSVSEVLGVEGERAFNRCLTEILDNQIIKENIVVTTDESIVNVEKARALLKSEFTVYLEVSTAVQIERSIANGDYHPLLPVDDFAAFLDQQHAARDNLYKEVASFSLSSDNGDIEAHTMSIINAMPK